MNFPEPTGKRIPLPYLDDLVPDELIIIDDIKHAHNRLGSHKIKDPQGKKKYQQKKIELCTKTWDALLALGKVTGIEPINSSQLTVEFPQSYGIGDKKPNKIFVSRYTSELRFGGLYNHSEKTFFVFWADKSQNDFYKHI